LLNIISSKLKKTINNKKENISQLKICNNTIYSLISNVFKQNQHSRNKINTVSLNNYFKKINTISINILNEYFIKKINLDYSKTGNSFIYTINDSITEQKKLTIPYLDKKLSNGKYFTLVLDLDDTLINYKLDEKGRGILRPRPNLYNFLNEMRQIFEMIIFTAGTSEYADPILNIIDKKKIIFDKILYRQHTIIMDNVFVKDLSKLGRDLSKVIIIDNMPQNFKLQKENGIFIKSFNGDNKKDSTLFDLIPILKKITENNENDVRVELNKMKNEIFTKITTNLQNEEEK
jgi:Dullard-like phosphatase family protein